MRRMLAGFTLIEVIVFIIVSGLLLSAVMMGSLVALRGTPTVHQQWVAAQLARKCMEWYVGQRYLNGYASVICPSTPTPTACTAPSGFSIATNITCTTWNGDPAYKLITVRITGLANATLSWQLGDY